MQDLQKYYSKEPSKLGITPTKYARSWLKAHGRAFIWEALDSFKVIKM